MSTLADGLKEFQIMDNLGSVRDVVSYDTNTAVFACRSYDYKPFGDSLTTSSGAEERMGFIGMERNTAAIENSYFNLGARTYDPETGRFLSVDPLFEIYPEHTPYHYAYNSPLVWKDPSGLASLMENVGDGDFVFTFTVGLNNPLMPGQWTKWNILLYPSDAGASEYTANAYSFFMGTVQKIMQEGNKPKMSSGGAGGGGEYNKESKEGLKKSNTQDKSWVPNISNEDLSGFTPSSNNSGYSTFFRWGYAAQSCVPVWRFCVLAGQCWARGEYGMYFAWGGVALLDGLTLGLGMEYSPEVPTGFTVSTDMTATETEIITTEVGAEAATEAGGEAAGAIENSISRILKGDYTYTPTAAKHVATRPYMNSPTTISNLMRHGVPLMDKSWPGGINFYMTGWWFTSNGNLHTGVFELGINPETNVIYHFLFIEAK